jgi:hypothetical protein
VAYDLAKEDILLVARDLTAATLPDDVWADVIVEVKLEVSSAGWGSDANAKMGAKWLGAHKALLRKRAAAGGAGSAAAGPLIAVTAGKLSKQYAAPKQSMTASPGDAALESTTYGLEFLRLRRLFGRRMAVT